MKILMDTHTMLWFFSDDDKLSGAAKQAIENRDNTVAVSIASFWEIAIKMSLKKLVIDVSFERLFQECDALDIDILKIDKAHLSQLGELPYIHRDPFDRLIISKAMVEGYTLASADGIFPRYNIQVIW